MAKEWGVCLLVNEAPATPACASLCAHVTPLISRGYVGEARRRLSIHEHLFLVRRGNVDWHLCRSDRVPHLAGRVDVAPAPQDAHRGCLARCHCLRLHCGGSVSHAWPT